MISRLQARRYDRAGPGHCRGGAGLALDVSGRVP